jgi:hypothetical protein
MTKRNIQVYQSFDIETKKTNLFFLEKNEQCNFLCIYEDTFLFKCDNLNDEELNNLEKILNFFKTEKNITKEPLMPNRQYKGLSYSYEDKSLYFENSLKEKLLDIEFMYKGCLMFEDENNNIHLFTKTKAKYSDEAKLDGYHRVMIFDNKKGEFVNSVKKEEKESIAVTLFGYINNTLYSLEQIEKKEIDKNYKLTNVLNELYSYNEIEKYLNKIDYSLSNKINFSEINDVIKNKARYTNEYFIELAKEKLSKFNLSNIKYLYLFAETVFAPGHYEDINTIAFSTKKELPANKNYSFKFLDIVKI